MKKLYVYFICIGIIVATVFVGCRQEVIDENCIEIEEDGVILRDPLFLDLKQIINEWNSLEILEILVKEIPIEDVGNEVDRHFYMQQQAIREKMMTLRQRYSNFSTAYYLALWNSKNHVPTRSSHSYLEEITVLGDCHLSAAVFQDILSLIKVIKSEYCKTNPSTSDQNFYYKLGKGEILFFPQNVTRAIKVISDELGRGFVANGCYRVGEFAEKMRKQGVYLMELRSILYEAMLEIIEYNQKHPRKTDNSGNGGGGGQEGVASEQWTKSLPLPLQTIVKNILKAFEKNGFDFSHVSSKVSVRFEELTNGNLAEIRLRTPPGETYFKQVPSELILPPFYREDEYLLIVTHELFHLALFDISWTAENMVKLMQINPALARYLDLGFGVDPHHEYMGRIIIEYEDILRDAFPGKPEEFYTYGKWGGGITDSYRFKRLPLAQQERILEYLKNHNLL